jgi:hypothetical protein
MSERPTDDLVRALASDLAPVRPIPPLRAMVAALLGLAAGGGALAVALTGGLRPDLGQRLAGDGVFAGAALALALACAGGSLAACAGSVPGRDAPARAGLGLVALAALGWCAALLLLVAAPGGLRAPAAGDLRCLGLALAAGLPGAAAGFAFVRRAAPRRGLAYVLAALGAVAVGGLALHLSCPSPEPSHWCWAHAGAPLAAALLVAAALAARRPRAG